MSGSQNTIPEQDKLNAQLLINLMRDMENLQELVREQDKRHIEEQATLQQKLAAVHAQISDVLDAFPDGDVRGHHDAHQEMIEEAKARKEARRKLVSSLVEKSVWAVLGAIFLGALSYFQIMLGRK